METVKERTERKESLDYKLKIDPIQVPAEACMNDNQVPVMEEEFEIDNYRYSISKEELHERIERGRQKLREGRCVPLDDAFIERIWP